MFKNVASQKLIVFAFDATTNVPKTGDAANITAYVSIDYGAVTVLGDTSATEMDATNAPGYYLFDLTQAETNGKTLLFSGKSSTANIKIIGAPAVVFTRPVNADVMSIDSNGRLDIIKVAGTTQTAGDLAAMLTIIDDFIDTEIATLITAVDDLPTNAELATALAAADDAILAAIAALNNLSAAQVNAEVVDALAVDTYAEPGQGTPGATITLAAKINYLYKLIRNKVEQTSAETRHFNSAGTVVDHKAAVSDDGTTFTRAVLTTGP